LEKKGVVGGERRENFNSKLTFFAKWSFSCVTLTVRLGFGSSPKQAKKKCKFECVDNDGGKKCAALAYLTSICPSPVVHVYYSIRNI
jgi:hypothetical protein